MDQHHIDAHLENGERKEVPRFNIHPIQRKKKHEHLYSPTEEYRVLEVLGQGSFGRVVKCIKMSTIQFVAVKITDLHSSTGSYQHELKILERVNKEDTEKFNFVRAFDSFTINDQGFLVCELLVESLRDYAKKPLPLEGAKLIMSQLLSGLAKLKEMKMIHADIKPENIMLNNPIAEPFRIKIIDFGSAIDMTKGIFPKYLQSRYYRAPEVLLGLPYCESVDMWSAGCVLADLLLGTPLFPGYTDYDQMRYICHVLGLPVNSMLENNQTAAQFFCKEKTWNGEMNSVQEKWRLKTTQEYEKETGIKTRETRKIHVNDVTDIILVQMRAYAAQEDSRKGLEETLFSSQCADLLSRMLCLRQENRITPETALKHGFLSR